MAATAIVGGQLVMGLQVASLEDGIIIPRSKRRHRIFLELGANTIYNAKQTFMMNPSMNNVFIVSAEPLLDKYMQNLELEKQWSANSALGAYIPNGRGVILPVAIGPKEGFSNFTVGSISGCSSMLPTGNNTSHMCNKVKELRLVPTVTLKTLLAWMGNPLVEFAKIDIQGMDFFAVESAGSSIKLLQRVQMEVPVKLHINKGSPGCAEVISKMGDLGFRLGTADEAKPYVPLEGAYGTPLMYAGSNVDCDSAIDEADLFMVR